MSDSPTPVEVFYSYAHKDESFRAELENHLSLLRRQGIISEWHERHILPGTNWAQTIDEHLEQASIILLLVSADFLASDYCYGVEMQSALQRHQAKQARVIPILLRPVDWHGAPFAHLQALPTNAKAISTWKNRDRAFADVAAGLRRAVEYLSLQTSAPRAALPPVWNVPYPRNTLFIGREALLVKLRQHLQAGQATALSQPQAISGLGGIGKTQIAVEYAYRFHQDYQVVLWARAETTEALTSSYVTIASLLNLPEQEVQEQAIKVQAVNAWLQTHSGWLLILDNADDLALVPAFLPPALGGHLLLTTRAQAMGRLANRLEVDTLSPEQGALFLLRRAALLAPNAELSQASARDQELAVQISQELGGLPLALDQAGAYLEETGMGLADYWQIYQQHRANLLQKRGGLVADHPTPVATTWSLSFERVEQRNPAAADLLRLCAFLAADAIPEEMLTKGALNLGAVLGMAAADPFLFAQTIEALRAVSLLNRDPRTRMLSIHRLVQAVLRNEMGKAASRCWAERAIKMVAAALPAIEYVHQPTWERFVGHALACAELAWCDNLHMTEAVLLLQQTGSYLDWCSRHKEAESLLEHALVIGTKVYGADCLEIVTILDRLASLYQRQGKYEEAESLFLRALAVHKQHSGPEHPDTAGSLNMLAVCCLRQDRDEEAESLFQQALAIYEQQLGPEHPYTASIIHNLAGLYEEQGRDEEAKPLFLRALAIYEQHLGSEDLGAPFFKNVGFLYLRQDKYEEAEILFQRALASWEQLVGPEQFSTTVGLRDLAFLYENQGKYEKAEPLYQRALAILERILGPEHPDTAAILNNLAALYRVQGKYEQAEPLYQRALAIREKQLGLEHPKTQSVRGNYASLLRAMGRDAEAAALEVTPTSPSSHTQ